MSYSPARIEIRSPQGHVLRWHAQLRDRLARLLPHSSVSLALAPAPAAWPDGVAALLALERLLLRRSRATPSDAIDAPTAPRRDDADLVIDLAGDTMPGQDLRVLRPLYEGEASDDAAVAALLCGGAPSIAVLDVGAGAIVAQGLPSLEAADGLTGGLEAVYSRMASLIEGALVSPPLTLTPAPRTARAPSTGPASFALRSIAHGCARAIYHLCCHSPHWRVGWRFVDGPGLLDGGAPRPGWRIMQDREMSFAADPFPWQWRGETGVFYERLDYRSNRGEIYYQRFDENVPAGEPTIALAEAWHLSYPFLLEQDDTLYMVPEASASGKITLYRCVEFPGRWEPVANLVEGVEAADATIFQHEGRFWMTSVVREGVGGYSDTLAIHHAPALLGPWEEHAQRPALVDSRYARPAGWVVERAGALLRPAQDCAAGYGFGVHVMRVDALTPETFTQTPLRRIGPGNGWPGKRLHTLNRHGRLEVIDGVVLTPKPLAARRLTHRIIDRKGGISDPGD